MEPEDKHKNTINAIMLLILLYAIALIFYTIGYDHGIEIEYQCSAGCTDRGSRYGYYGLLNKTPQCICANMSHGYITDTVKLADNRLIAPKI